MDKHLTFSGISPFSFKYPFDACFFQVFSTDMLNDAPAETIPPQSEREGYIGVPAPCLSCRKTNLYRQPDRTVDGVSRWQSNAGVQIPDVVHR
jgi:hypothetical protein